MEVPEILSQNLEDRNMPKFFNILSQSNGHIARHIDQGPNYESETVWNGPFFPIQKSVKNIN